MNKISGKEWKYALQSGINSLLNNVTRIDALNVFPVPDGDTGSNMGSTSQSAIMDVEKLNEDNLSIAKVANTLAKGMLMGARGNSGVILSQIFKGFAVAFEGKDSVSAIDFVEAFKQAKEFGYKSVMTPVEGTILTVIKDVADSLSNTVTMTYPIEKVFQEAKGFARKSCDNTPNLLPVLKEVGVVDSGGEGLFVIIEGIYKYFLNEPIKLNPESNFQNNNNTPVNITLFGDKESFEGEFGYCTEFIVELNNPEDFKADRFKVTLEKMGNSIVMVTDDDLLKVHIHTLTPGKVFTFAQKFGEFLKIKSENMTLQANASTSLKSIKNNTNNEKINIGIISCNVGNGIISEMKELGADFIIESGQTMNPSTKDFLDAIKQINTDQIIILPNNSNIILAAQQVVQTVLDKKIVIVPTKTQMQGLVAMMNFDRSASLSDNQEEMTDAMDSVKTGQITKSTRNTRIDGVAVRENEYLAIAEKKILKSTDSKVESAILVAKELIDDDTEIVTIYYGDDSTEIDAEELLSFIETHYNVKVEVKDGGQPLYNFLIAFE